jgi:hypothetical protein
MYARERPAEGLALGGGPRGNTLGPRLQPMRLPSPVAKELCEPPVRSFTPFGLVPVDAFEPSRGHAHA